MKRVQLCLLVLMILTCLVLVGLEAQALLQKDPDPGDGSCTNYKCDWCCQQNCGCSDPGEGFHFTGWCSCSSIDCNRNCNWTPAK